MSNQGIKKLYKNLGFTRYIRIQNYINLLENKYEVNSEIDKDKIKEIHFLIHETIRAVRALGIIITISYFGIYFSAISAIFSTTTTLPILTEAIGKIVGFFGTTLFFVILFFANKLNDLYYQDLNLMTSHLITIYAKHHMIENKLYSGDNTYESFINFFKREELL